MLKMKEHFANVRATHWETLQIVISLNILLSVQAIEFVPGYGVRVIPIAHLCSK